VNQLTARGILRQTWSEIRADDVFGRSAQLAYYFFLALFPFLICVIATLSVFGTADRGRDLLLALTARLLPAVASDLVARTFSEIITSNGPLKMSIGIIASLWSASLGMSAVMDTLNAAYKVQETRSIIQQAIVAVTLTFGIGLLVVVATLAVITGDIIARSLSMPHLLVIGWRIIEWPLAVVLLLLGLETTYYFAPDLKTRTWQWLSAGSVAGVVLLLLVSLGFKFYLHFAGNYTATYGSLGGVIVLLLCFYFGGVAVLAGGALDGVMKNRASEMDCKERL
jgi:membrane protein